MKSVFTLHVIAGILSGFLACQSAPHIAGTCSDTIDCNTEPNKQADGMICAPGGVCRCPGGTRACYPKSWNGEGKCREACVFENECAIVTDAGSDAPAPACHNDSECPQPPDEECGKGSCVQGTCKLDISPGPLPSQVYGDCKRSECNELGKVSVVADPNDYFDDGNSCTIDYCKNGPENPALQNGSLCTGPGQGYCYESKCVECISNMPGAQCSGGDACDFFWCVPFPMCSNKCGGACAPCGAGAGCSADSDCASLSCVGGMCKLPDCMDGRRNGDETGIDCGAGCPKACPDGDGCFSPDHCLSGVCKAGKCEAPTCFDAVMNGAEKGIDCGGPCDPCK